MSLASKLPYAVRLRTAKYLLRSLGAGPHQLRLASRYVTGALFAEGTDDAHLRAAVEWLHRAQDACGGDGVSNVYFLTTGWGVAYPETSGYIIATLLAYADCANDRESERRAVRLGDWEIEIQAPNGGVFSSTALRQTRVFNTGQVVLGWCRLYEYTQDGRYLEAAARAGEYLVKTQESDGTWVTDTFCGARTYHARVDWALLRLAQLTSQRNFAVAAAKNLRWVLAQQQANGWLENCGFHDDSPITHVIAYTFRGLLESSQMNDSAIDGLDLLPAAIRGVDSLCRAIAAQPVANIPGMVPASFDRNWKGDTRDSCLTGNAQIAGVLYRLAHCTNDPSYPQIAAEILSATKRTQALRTSLPQIRGAIPGSYPISHGYVANGYPNWAAKFFADALLMKINFAAGLVIPA
jgi:hypothetical protein